MIGVLLCHAWVCSGVCVFCMCVSPTSCRKNHRRSLNLCPLAIHLLQPLVPAPPTLPRVVPTTRRPALLEHRHILESLPLLQHPKPPSLLPPRLLPLLLPHSNLHHNLHKAHNLPSHWPAAPPPAQFLLLTPPTSLARLTPLSLTPPHPPRPPARLRQPEWPAPPPYQLLLSHSLQSITHHSTCTPVRTHARWLWVRGVASWSNRVQWSIRMGRWRPSPESWVTATFFLPKSCLRPDLLLINDSLGSLND